MQKCPVCGSEEEFCEHPDVDKGEVEGYYCLNCGYDSTKEE